MSDRYLFIDEDGCLTVGDEISQGVRDAFNGNICDVVDMKTRTILVATGPDLWDKMEKNDW